MHFIRSGTDVHGGSVYLLGPEDNLRLLLWLAARISSPLWLVIQIFGCRLWRIDRLRHKCRPLPPFSSSTQEVFDTRPKNILVKVTIIAMNIYLNPPYKAFVVLFASAQEPFKP